MGDKLDRRESRMIIELKDVEFRVLDAPTQQLGLINSLHGLCFSASFAFFLD
jgi:hypothetical protein